MRLSDRTQEGIAIVVGVIVFLVGLLNLKGADPAVWFFSIFGALGITVAIEWLFKNGQ